MKIAVIYNRESRKVINLFGTPNREKYGLASIRRITNALKKGGHQVIALEGDKDLIDRLEDFMPQVVKNERPGLAFNLSYGIQGQARYTHVPGILEMVGIPYVGSGPLAHSLALDKVVAKMIFRQQGLPTPDFAVLDAPGFEMPELKFPLIVKPKNEAVSFGIKIVNNETELREAADIIFEQFEQPVLAEQYIEGREINVGIIGNSPPEAFPPAEILFGEGGPRIYTLEDKTRKSGREIGVQCPAELSEELGQKAQKIAMGAFKALSCVDCARVDMRLDSDGNFYILEINSLPSLGEHGSYVQGAAAVGMDFTALVNRLVEVASARYFGTPTPPEFAPGSKQPEEVAFNFLTGRRDAIEKRLEEWAAVSSRTDDPIGLQTAQKKLDDCFAELDLFPVRDLTDPPHVQTWETRAGLDGGTLLIGHLDVPLPLNASPEPFHRDPEYLFGEGIGASRAPIVMLEYALRALKTTKRLRQAPIGVLYYSDEGKDNRFSAKAIAKAAARAGQVLVLRAGNAGNMSINQRRGQRKYRLTVEGKPRKLGSTAVRSPEPLGWICHKLEDIAGLSSRKDRVAVSAVDIRPEAYPQLLPHRVTVDLLMSFPHAEAAEALEARMRGLLGKGGPRWNLTLVSHRPAMVSKRNVKGLADGFRRVAEQWEIPFGVESSLWPSAAGLVPAETPVLCGIGPCADGLYTNQEAVSRISLIQRTLLLTEVLLAQGKEAK